MAGYNLELLAIAYATGNGPVMTRNPQCESAGDAAVLHTNCDNVCAQAELGNSRNTAKTPTIHSRLTYLVAPYYRSDAQLNQ